MTLLQQIIQDASGPVADLPTLLRRTKVLARKLQNQMLESWIDKELRGYDFADELPPYRILKTSSMGRFLGDGMRVTLRINPSVLPDDKWRDMASTVRLYDRIGDFAASLKNPPANPAPGIFWSLDHIHWAQNNINFYENLKLESAWRMASLSDYQAMLEDIQGRVLDFVLNVEDAAPDAGEAAVGDAPPLPVTVTNRYVINAFQFGGAQNIQTGSQNSLEAITHSVELGNWSSLESALSSLGVSSDLIAGLQPLLTDDGEVKPTGLNEGLQSWIANAATSIKAGALEGAGSMGAQAAITAAIQTFLGAIGAS